MSGTNDQDIVADQIGKEVVLYCEVDMTPTGISYKDIFDVTW